jgi:hypothetical protein
VPGQLGGQTALEHRLDQLRQEPTRPGQGQPVPVDPAHQLVEQARLDHVVDRLARRRRRRLGRHAQRVLRLLLLGHDHCVLLSTDRRSCTQTI